jgi:hypothetical protein
MPSVSGRAVASARWATLPPPPPCLTFRLRRRCPPGRDCKCLDTPDEQRFDSITALIKDMFQVGRRWRRAVLRASRFSCDFASAARCRVGARLPAQQPPGGCRSSLGSAHPLACRCLLSWWDSSMPTACGSRAQSAPTTAGVRRRLHLQLQPYNSTVPYPPSTRRAPCPPVACTRRRALCSHHALPHA